jgi:hypothetical protein
MIMSQAEKPNNTSRLSRRNALAGLAGVGSTLVAAAIGSALGEGPPAPAPSTVDPIFEVIAEHKAAVDAHWVTSRATWDMGGGPADEPRDSPTHVAAEKANDLASDRESEAMGELFATAPTTVAGVAALLEHLAAPEWPRSDDTESVIRSAYANMDHDEGNDNDVDTQLRTISAVLRAAVSS